jgi:hypothetical protein
VEGGGWRVEGGGWRVEARAGRRLKGGVGWWRLEDEGSAWKEARVGGWSWRLEGGCWRVEAAMCPVE